MGIGRSHRIQFILKKSGLIITCPKVIPIVYFLSFRGIKGNILDTKIFLDLISCDIIRKIDKTEVPDASGKSQVIITLNSKAKIDSKAELTSPSQTIRQDLTAVPNNTDAQIIISEEQTS